MITSLHIALSQILFSFVQICLKINENLSVTCACESFQLLSAQAINNRQGYIYMHAMYFLWQYSNTVFSRVREYCFQVSRLLVFSFLLVMEYIYCIVPKQNEILLMLVCLYFMVKASRICSRLLHFMNYLIFTLLIFIFRISYVFMCYYITARGSYYKGMQDR